MVLKIIIFKTFCIAVHFESWTRKVLTHKHGPVGPKSTLLLESTPLQSLLICIPQMLGHWFVQGGNSIRGIPLYDIWTLYCTSSEYTKCIWVIFQIMKTLCDIEGEISNWTNWYNFDRKIMSIWYIFQIQLLSAINIWRQIFFFQLLLATKC